MRNIFDQYTLPENRLSHALAVCLDEDRRLLRDFLKWIGANPSKRRLIVTEQQLPGDPPASEEEAERRGLPDIVIHDGDTWCVLIENKVQAGLTADQLSRHANTLRRRSFESIRSIALTKTGEKPPRGVRHLTWSDLYQWLGKTKNRGPWAERLRAYLRAAEVRLVHARYLTEGTLTMFDGFKFDADNPYTYGEGKRLLRLAIAELRKSPVLRKLGMDPRAESRSAITGRDETGVWDFLQLADRPDKPSHTHYPHLTLGVHADHLEVQVSIPDRVPAPVRRRLAELGVEGIVALNGRILRNSKRVLPSAAWIETSIVQRHHKSQRSHPTTDAALKFKLETSQPRGKSPVKLQVEWVQTFVTLLRQKDSNIHFGYVARLPWGSTELRSRESIQTITETWCAMKPVLDVLRGSKQSR